MRGTSIFSLPGLLVGAALGITKETQVMRNESLISRLRHQYFAWRADYWAAHALKDFNAGKTRQLHKEHLESVDNFINLHG